MKSSSYPTILLSTAVAVLLWLAATLLEDDARWMPPVATNTIDTSLAAPRPETPLRVNSDAMSCEQVEAGLVQQVDEAQYCSTNDDCTLFDYGYPIQCLTSVAKSEISALRLAYRNYENSCSYRVYYDCPSGPMERQAVCRNNRCEVDLVGNEPLTDETLQHLGIKDL